MTPQPAQYLRLTPSRVIAQGKRRKAVCVIDDPKACEECPGSLECSWCPYRKVVPLGDTVWRGFEP